MNAACEYRSTASLQYSESGIDIGNQQSAGLLSLNHYIYLPRGFFCKMYKFCLNADTCIRFLNPVVVTHRFLPSGI